MSAGDSVDKDGIGEGRSVVEGNVEGGVAGDGVEGTADDGAPDDGAAVDGVVGDAVGGVTGVEVWGGTITRSMGAVAGAEDDGVVVGSDVGAEKEGIVGDAVAGVADEGAAAGAVVVGGTVSGVAVGFSGNVGISSCGVGICSGAGVELLSGAAILPEPSICGAQRICQPPPNAR